MYQRKYTSVSYLEYATYILALVLSVLLVYAPFPRGMFFREDYLRFFPCVGWTCLAVAFISLFGKRKICHFDLDALLFLITALYWIASLWAVSKKSALDGAVKYTTYLATFLVARYLGQTSLGNRILRNGLVISGLTASLVGLLSAAKIISYPSAVISGRIYGSFQYPNALAAYAMFVLFFCLYAWLEAENFRHLLVRWLSSLFYSLTAFSLVTVIVLSYSRATWLILGFCLTVYFLFLPVNARGKVFWHLTTTVAAVLATSRQVADALLKDNFLAIRKYLLTGISIAATLEVLGLFTTDVIESLKSREHSDKSTDPSQPHTVTNISDSKIAMGGILRPVVGALLTITVAVGAFSTSLGRSVLVKILPQSIVQRFSSISLYDKSLVIRFHATLDAFLIARDYPFGTGAGGWNALYHMYQKTLYWFTETHNHFAQILVETGFPGLILYVLFWAGLLHVFIKAFLCFRRNSNTLSSPAKVSEPFQGHSIDTCQWFEGVLSSAVGILSLGLHSSADFDLSLPSISMALFAAIGVFFSQTENLVNLGSMLVPFNTLTWPWLQRSNTAKGKVKDSKKQSNRTHGSFSTVSKVAEVVAILVVALFIIKPSGSYFQGIVLGSYGVYTISNGDVSGGRNYLLSAIRYDPHQSSYAMDLARTYVREYRSHQDESSRRMAKLYLDLARRTDPFNFQDRVDQASMLYELGLYDDSVDSAKEVLKLCPLDKSLYDMFSTCARAAMWQHLEAWEKAVAASDEKVAKKEVESIRSYSAYVNQIPVTLSRKKEAVKGTYAAVWDPKELDPTQGTLLLVGQVAYLQGNQEEAIRYLSEASKDKNLANEASNWLYSLSRATGTRVSIPDTFKPDERLVHIILPAYGIAK